MNEEGINLIDIAQNSNYFLTDALTVDNMKKHFGLDNPGEEHMAKGGSELDNFEFEKMYSQKVMKDELEKEEYEKKRDE